MARKAFQRTIKDPLRPFVVQERMDVDDPWTDMASFAFEGDANRALDSHRRKYGSGLFRMKPPKKNPMRKSRHKGRRVRPTSFYINAGGVKIKKILTERNRSMHIKSPKLTTHRHRVMKRRAKRNPKTAGHFVYVDYFNKKGVHSVYWLTADGKLDSSKAKAKCFDDLTRAKIAARGLGPKLPDSVEGVWIADADKARYIK